MISTIQLQKCLRKSNPNLYIYGHRSSLYDCMPASVHLAKRGENEWLFSVPKGMVYERTFYEPDGSIEHRGYRETVDKLSTMRLINKEIVLKAIQKAEAGFYVS